MHIDYISKKASKRLYSLRILKKVGVNRDGILKVYLTTIRPILEYGVQVWQDIPEFLLNKLESIQKGALHIIHPCHSYLVALNTTNLSSLEERHELSSAVNIFGRCLKMIILLSSSNRKQQLVVIVTTCCPATTIEILFTLIGVAAGPSVQIPLSYSLVNM